MELTEEQKERIRKNRERAMEIRRRKAEEAKKKQQEEEKKETTDLKIQPQQQSNYFTKTSTTSTASTSTTRRIIKNDTNNNKNGNTKKEPTDDEDIELDDFEIDASPYVTKQEAMKMYCLPEGTLAVCAYIEKDNPRKSQWKKMKLYHRNEIRKWSRERWGSLEGLVEERRRRELKRFERDFDEVQDVFSSKKKRKK